MKPPIEFVKKQNKKNLIIFIHGFTSESSTWTNKDNVTFPDMLMKDKIINQNYDFSYFNYFTKLLDFKTGRFTAGLIRTVFGGASRSKKNVGIKSLSEHLKSSIDIFCHEYENIVLVAHSLGGLVSKAYILDEISENINPKVKLFLSLAVPHKGSNWAVLGGKLAKNNPQVIDLKPLSDFLDTVNDLWIQQKDDLPKTVYYYGQFDRIVDEQNAISFQVGKKFKVACNYDHFDICKPESENSIVFQGVKKDLIDFINDLKFIEDMKPQMYIDDGKLDDEIFVLKLFIADIHKSLIKDSKQTFFNAEFMTRALLKNRGDHTENLNQLYTNLERLYRIYYVKFIDDEIKSSNELVTKIFENIIDRDKEYLKTAIPLVDANKKTGMLQQLANNLDNDIWWAKDQSIKNIDDFRKARDSSE